MIDEIVRANLHTSIGNYWERGNKNEIDIVAVDELVRKSVNILQKFKGYEVEYRLLCIDDIEGLI